ncbi:4695_t:CDS:2 [Acaulospora colombiana]|uniref:4695_t:CDS:1 n=1 Tax=Acaulospora colombiana TaxID=27376 RepID=A0ACA9M660_9GLOM|nr:4695_t:CDS:2 [Acaulospora colombiana]
MSYSIWMVFYCEGFLLKLTALLMPHFISDSERVYTEIWFRDDLGYQVPVDGKTSVDIHSTGYILGIYQCLTPLFPAERVSAELLWALLPGIEKHLSVDDYITERRRLQDLQWPHVSLLPGAAKLVRHLHAHNIPIAVATGSLRRNFLLKTADERCSKEKVEVFQLFREKVICGDDGPMGRSIWGTEKVVRGKPAPDIFLCAAEMVGRNVGRDEIDVSEEQKVERKRGLVFEDGIPGVEAASRAGMQGEPLITVRSSKETHHLPSVVWVPDANLLALDPKLDVPKISTLENFIPEEWGLPPYDADPRR